MAEDVGTELRKNLIGDSSDGGFTGFSVEELSVDSLTGLKNRGIWEKEVEDFLKHAKRNHEKVALMFADADKFKHINDTYGHDVGDKVLIAIAESMNERLRESDIIGRLGGDEFVALLTDFTNSGEHEADFLTDKIKESVINKMRGIVPESEIGISVGVVNWNGEDKLSVFLKKADEIMYSRKNNV